MTPAEIFRLQVRLRAVKRCRGACGKVKPVAEFAGYGVTICDACDAVPTPVVEPAESIAEPDRRDGDVYDACPGCGRGKFYWLPICRPCKSKQPVGAGAS